MSAEPEPIAKDVAESAPPAEPAPAEAAPAPAPAPSAPEPSEPAPIASGKNAPTRRITPAAHTPAKPLSPATRASIAALGFVERILSPLGWLFRIRENLGIPLRAALPLVLVAALGVAWHRATLGEFYLARFSKLSPLDEQRLAIEAVAHCPVRLITREKKLWTSPEPLLEIHELVLPKAAFEEHRDEIAKLGQFDVELSMPEAPSDMKLRAKFNTFFGDRLPKKTANASEADRKLAALEAALSGATIERRPLDPARERELVIIERAIVAPDVASSKAARDALDAIVGAGSWTTAPSSDGRVAIAGTEHKEERFVTPIVLPSPREMVEQIPSLLNLRWNSWDDASAWWRGEERGHGRFEGPLKLDRTRPNDVPFALLDGFFFRVIGPGWKDWQLLHAVLWSTMRIVIGFAYAALVAIPLGVLMGSFSKMRALFEPIRLMGSYLPLPAFGGLTIAWWGTTESQRVGFLFITCFVVLLPQVITAVEAIPQVHIDSARTLGATRLQLMRYVLYAGAKAEIFRALRITFAVGWTWIILAEGLDPKAGLGWIIQLGDRRPEHKPHIYAVIVLIVALAFVVNSAWAWVERKLYPYREAMSE